MGIRSSVPPLAVALFMLSLLGSGTSAVAQSAGLELHANDHASPAEIGLPGYPGASLYKTKDNEATFDLGYSFGDSHFRLLGANYITTDSPSQVLAFYRKPLSRYGEVLECKDGKPIGALTVTKSGLTCSDERGGNVQFNGHDDSKDHELRAGTPHEYRIVGIDNSEPKSTHFAMIYVQLPKDSDSAKKSK